MTWTWHDDDPATAASAQNLQTHVELRLRSLELAGSGVGATHYLAADGVLAVTGASGDILLNAGGVTIEEQGGTSIVIGNDGRLKLVDEGMYALTLTARYSSGHGDATYIGAGMVDDNSPSWGLQHYLPATLPKCVLSATYRFTANDPVTLNVLRDGTGSLNIAWNLFAVRVA